MIAKLGFFLYWASRAIALGILAVAIWTLFETGEPQPRSILFYIVPAAIFWLLGWVARYFLGGK